MTIQEERSILNLKKSLSILRMGLITRLHEKYPFTGLIDDLTATEKQLSFRNLKSIESKRFPFLERSKSSTTNLLFGVVSNTHTTTFQVLHLG